jgi:hypothetical protein
VDPSGHSHARWRDHKSLLMYGRAEDKAKLNALKWILLKYGKVEDIKLKRLTGCFYLILSIGMPYYQEGCNISELTKVKVLVS